jgi:hypothetical protein
VTFQTTIGPREYDIEGGATVGIARDTLAGILGRPFESVLVASGHILDDSVLIASCGELSLICLLDIAVVFEGETFNMLLDFDRPLGELLPVIANELEVPVGEFELTIERQPLDLRKTLNELGARPDAVVTAARQSAVPAQKEEGKVTRLSFTLLIGPIPRQSKFDADSAGTLGDLKEKVRERFGLADVPFDFAIGDLENDEMTCLPPSTVIGTIEVSETRALGIVAAGASPSVVPVDAPSLNRQLQTSLRPAPAAAAAGANLSVSFAVLGEDPFSLEFPPKATVRDAKRLVADLRNTTPAFATLLFGGKALNDTFLLGRLRLGGTPISVHLKDAGEVLLVTAGSMRDTISKG